MSAEDRSPEHAGTVSSEETAAGHRHSHYLSSSAPACSKPTCSTDTAGRRQLPFRKKLLFFGIVVGLCALSAELLLRGYLMMRGWTMNVYAPHLFLLKPHELNGYELQPGFRLKSGAFDISINSLGLRGPKVSIQKPTGVQRIAVIGGSSVYGYLVNDDQVAARLLEARLQATMDQPFEVLNAGVPGYDLAQSTARFREVVLPMQPDIVILYLGYNDIGHLVANDSQQQARSPQLPYRPWERYARHSVLYTCLAYRLSGAATDFGIGRRTQSGPTVAGVARFRRQLEEFLELAQAHEIRVIICSQATAARPGVSDELRPAIGRTEEELDRAIAIMQTIRETLQDVARHHELPFVDAYHEIPATSEMLGDAIHLTPAGEKQLAKLWLTELQRLGDQ